MRVHVNKGEWCHLDFFSCATWPHVEIQPMHNPVGVKYFFLVLWLVLGVALCFHGIMGLNGTCMLKDRLAFDVNLRGINLYLSSYSLVSFGMSFLLRFFCGVFTDQQRSSPALYFLNMFMVISLTIGVLLSLLLLLKTAISSIVT